MASRTNPKARGAASLSGATEESVTVGDTLMPLMTVESSVVNSDGTALKSRASSSGDIQPRLSRTFSSCDIVYTKPDPKQNASRFTKKVVAKCEHQYHSHEALPSSVETKVDSKLRRLTRTQSERADMEDGATPTPEKPSDAQSRWGVLQSKAIALNQVKKDKRRAQIVANVTKRLYKKKVDTPPEPAATVAQPGEDDQEPDELKICSRARASLLELTRKALYAQRRRREVETQTEFCGHVLRVKEVGVGTDNGDVRKATETQCSITSHVLISKEVGTNCDDIKYNMMDDVYRRWGYHYRNGSGGQHARAWNYYPDSVIVTEHRFFKSNEEDFSDDSLDSNPDFDVKIQVEGLKKTEKPCVWKVVSITSGQMFNKPNMRPEVSKVNFCKSASIPNDEIINREDKTGQIKAAETSESTIDLERTTVECTCQETVKELHMIVKSLQQSVEKLNKTRNTPACMVQVCHGRVSHCHCDQHVGETSTQDSETCDSCKRKAGSKASQNTNQPDDLIGIVDCTSEPSEYGGINGGKLTLSRIRGFLYRWRSKCKTEEKCTHSTEQTNDTNTSKGSCGITFSEKHKELIILQKPKKSTDKPNGRATEIALNQNPMLECEPISTKSNWSLLEDETEKADIMKCSDVSSNETSHLKAFIVTVKEFLKKNCIQNISKNQSLSFYMEMLKSLIKHNNTIPKLRNPNGIISQVTLKNHEPNVEKGVPHNEANGTQLLQSGMNQTEILRREIPGDKVLDMFDDFTDDDKFPLPRTTPHLLHYDNGNFSEDLRADKDVEHWMDIKCLILGHNFDTFPDDDEDDLVERRRIKKKTVTWKDICGCGDLVQLRPLSPRDTMENDAIPNTYYERNSSAYSNLRQEKDTNERKIINYERNMLDETGFHFESFNESGRYSFEERFKLDLLSSPPKKRSKPDVFWHKNNAYEFKREYNLPKINLNFEKESLKNLSEKDSTSTADRRNCTTNMCGKFSTRSKYYQEKHKQISQILERRKRIQYNDLTKLSTQPPYQPIDTHSSHRKAMHFSWTENQVDIDNKELPEDSIDVESRANIKRKQPNVDQTDDHNFLLAHCQLPGGINITNGQRYITPNNSLDGAERTLRYKPNRHNCYSNSRNSMYYAWQSGYCTSNGSGVTSKELNDECTPLQVNDSLNKSKPIAVLDHNKNLIYSCCNNSNCECEQQPSPTGNTTCTSDGNMTRLRRSLPTVQDHRRSSPSEYMRRLLSIRRQVVHATQDAKNSV